VLSCECLRENLFKGTSWNDDDDDDIYIYPIAQFHSFHVGLGLRYGSCTGSREHTARCLMVQSLHLDGNTFRIHFHTIHIQQLHSHHMQSQKFVYLSMPLPIPDVNRRTLLNR